jgi:hypothetical protein
MKMDKYFVCCQNCFERIARVDTVSARLWMDFCKWQLECGKVLVFECGDFAEFRILENLGFIVSTEQADTISVKVQGHIYTFTDEHFFCIGNCEEEKERQQ